MKKVLTTTLLFMLIGFGTMAQQPEDLEPAQLDPKAQEKINNLRIAYLTDRLDLTSEQAEKFWPVYREFAQERRKIALEARTARGELDKNKEDPKRQQALLDLSLKTKQRLLDLEKDYSARMLKVITAEQVNKLRNADMEFRDLLQQRRLNQQRKENFRERNQRLHQKN
jgi:Spy/CpxP family protein refolding chaperone